MARTYYLWDEENDTLLAETDEAGNTIAEYTHEPGRYGPLISQRRNGHTYYHHYDGQGSTRALTDESGTVTDRYTYTAFGEPVASSGTTTNPFGYKGALGYYANPETDELYVRARYYQPAVGRWLSVDPIAYTDRNADFYRYVRNRPVSRVDPSGRIDCVDECATYVFNKCWWKCKCAIVLQPPYGFDLGGMFRDAAFRAREVTKELGYPDELTSSNIALRHCLGSGILVLWFGCGCSACTGDGREEWQWLHGGQSRESSQMGIYNNQEGRECAKCTGSTFSSSQPWFTPGIGFPQIKQCCKQKLLDGRLHMGGNQEGDLPRPLPDLPEKDA
jgi:RHS repeat-associated protein